MTLKEKKVIKELLRTMQPLLNIVRQELEDAASGYSGSDPHLLNAMVTDAKDAMKIARKVVKK